MRIMCTGQQGLATVRIMLPTGHASADLSFGTIMEKQPFSGFVATFGTAGRHTCSWPSLHGGQVLPQRPQPGRHNQAVVVMAAEMRYELGHAAEIVPAQADEPQKVVPSQTEVTWIRICMNLVDMTCKIKMAFHSQLAYRTNNVWVVHGLHSAGSNPCRNVHKLTTARIPSLPCSRM